MTNEHPTTPAPFCDHCAGTTFAHLADCPDADRTNDCAMCHERPGTTGVGPLWSGIEICHVCADLVDL